MQIRQLLIFIALSLTAVVAVIAAVSVFRKSEPPVQVNAPANSVDTGKTTVDTPGVHIEKDSQGTKIEAPGVKIEVPKPSNP
jgi:hypothetical protein